MEKRTGAAQRSRQAHKPPQRGNGSRILVVIAVVLAVMIVGVGCGFLTATLNTKQDLEDVKRLMREVLMVWQSLRYSA